jgi:RNA polymerase sigma-70 factor (ECF subfamily)
MMGVKLPIVRGNEENPSGPRGNDNPGGSRRGQKPMQQSQSKVQEFEATALPWLDAVYDTALRFTRGDTATAEDIAQETFLRAFSKWSTFQPGTNCRAWLLRIAYTVFVDDYRRRQRERLRAVDPAGDDDHPAQDPVDDAPGPEEEALRQLDGAALQRALDELPDPFRDTFILVAIRELSCQEAADVMGVQRGTVLSRLHRARGKLRAELQPTVRPAGDDG